jgi:hypothetical protein
VGERGFGALPPMNEFGAPIAHAGATHQLSERRQVSDLDSLATRGKRLLTVLGACGTPYHWHRGWGSDVTGHGDSCSNGNGFEPSQGG